MDRIVKTALKITASAVILLVVVVGGGVGYTWYAGQQSDENNQAFAEPATPSKKLPAEPVKIADDAKVGATVQSVTSPVTPGSNASIMVKTNPLVNCTISVVYDKTPSKDSGLKDKKADTYGLVEWTWTVESTVPLGSWPVKVTCANKKNSAMVQNDLKVVRTLE